MAKRTQGPWEARPHQFGGCWWVETPDGSIQVSMHISNNDKANARFIAAAPAMEQALLLAEAEYNAHGYLVKSVLQNIRAALAKANGDNL